LLSISVNFRRVVSRSGKSAGAGKMRQRVAHGFETRAQIARELFRRQRRARFQRPLVRPRIEITKQPKIFDIHRSASFRHSVALLK